jgi:hypothetical protein
MLNPTFQLVCKKETTQVHLHILSRSSQLYVTYAIDCDIVPTDAMYSLDSKLLIDALNYFQPNENQGSDQMAENMTDKTTYVGFKFDVYRNQNFLCVYDTPAYSYSRHIKLDSAQFESLLEIERLDQTTPDFFKSIEFETLDQFQTLIGVCLAEPILYTQVNTDDESVSLSGYDTSNRLVTKLYTRNISMKGSATPELFFDFKLLYHFLNNTDLSKQTCRFIWTCGRPVELEIGSSLVVFMAPCEHQQSSENQQSSDPISANQTKKKRKQ